MQRWLVMALTSRGVRTLAVSDGLQVWPAVVEEDIDLVVSDVRMPRRSGLEALTVLRITGIHVPFLLITAFACDEVRAAAAELGAEVLDKPFAATDLMDRVRRLCPPPDRARWA